MLVVQSAYHHNLNSTGGTKGLLLLTPPRLLECCWRLCFSTADDDMTCRTAFSINDADDVNTEQGRRSDVFPFPPMFPPQLRECAPPYDLASLSVGSSSIAVATPPLCLLVTYSRCNSHASEYPRPEADEPSQARRDRSRCSEHGLMLWSGFSYMVVMEKV